MSCMPGALRLSLFAVLGLAATAALAKPEAGKSAAARHAAATSHKSEPGVVSLDHGRFQDVHVYRPKGEVRSAVLLLSGDGGHREATSREMARRMAAHGALVTLIDSTQFYEELEADDGDCEYADGDLENLSHYVQAWAKVPGYRPPLLVGFSSGATFAYANLAQAPASTFAGALVMGFCPDFALKKPLCEGEGLKFKKLPKGRGVEFLPTAQLAQPFVALNGDRDRFCQVKSVQKFIDAIPAARQVRLPGVDHDYSDSAMAMQSFERAFARLASRSRPAVPAAPADLGDLPVIEEPAAAGTHQDDRLAIIWSGDGGWAGLDKDVAAALIAKGIPVVGVDSLRYFWAARTPEIIAADLDKIVTHYLRAWGKQRVLVIGYSQGADVLPFALTRLPAATRKKIPLAVGMGLSDHAVFEFHLSNWVTDNNDGPETLPEVRKLVDVPFLCIYGADEDDTICPQLEGSRAKIVKLPGGHHFDGNYEGLAQAILSAAP